MCADDHAHLKLPLICLYLPYWFSHSLPQPVHGQSPHCGSSLSFEACPPGDTTQGGVRSISYTYLKYNMYDLHIYIHQMVSYSMYTYICICIHHYIIIYMWHKSRLSVTCFSSFWYVHLWRFFFSLEEDVLPPCLHTQQYMGAGCCWNSMDIPREFRIWSLARRFFESIRQDYII